MIYLVEVGSVDQILLNYFMNLLFLLKNIYRGAEPKQLAFSGAVGITLGVFPICGILIFQLNCYRKLNILRLDAEMKKGKLIEFISTVTQLLNSSLTVRQNYFSENSVCFIRSAGITKGVRNISSCIFQHVEKNRDVGNGDFSCVISSANRS